MLYCSLLAKRKNPSVPVGSEFSKEHRWKMVQRSCNIQLQTSVESSDARKSEVSPRGLMRKMVALGR